MDFQLCLARVSTFKTLPRRSSLKDVLTFFQVYQTLCFVFGLGMHFFLTIEGFGMHFSLLDSGGMY